MPRLLEAGSHLPLQLIRPLLLLCHKLRYLRRFLNQIIRLQRKLHPSLSQKRKSLSIFLEVCP